MKWINSRQTTENKTVKEYSRPGRIFSRETEKEEEDKHTIARNRRKREWTVNYVDYTKSK